MENGHISIYGMAEKECVDRKNLPQCIKEAMASAKPNPIQSLQAIIAIPEEESFIKVIRLPKQDPKETKKSIEQEIGKLLPYAPEEMYWDWRLIEKDSKNNSYDEVMVEAATKKTIDSYIETVSQTGLEPIIIETEANALIWGSIDPFTPGRVEPTIVLNIGATKITTAIFANGAIPFTASFKKDAADQKDFISDVILEPIAKKLKEYIEYYNDLSATREKESTNRIQSVIITGESGISQAMLSSLEKKLSLPIKRPAKIIPIEPYCAIASGLALRALTENEPPASKLVAIHL